jgi:phosphatidylglycerophosphatase GEP4
MFLLKSQTYPYKDPLHPSIENGWKDLKETFGPGRVLVVSNSAGTRKDFGGIAVSFLQSYIVGNSIQAQVVQY